MPKSSLVVTAALERARRLHREAVDREIEETIRSDAAMQAEEYVAWQGTAGDGVVAETTVWPFPR